MIKYLLLIAVVLLVLWLLRQSRTKAAMRDTAEAAKTDLASPTEIVECARCHVHLPRSEALPDAQGRHYCGVAHRREAEGA